MRRILLCVALLASLAAVPLGLGLAAGSASAAETPIGWPGFACTVNHWIRDVSDGNRLVAVNPNGLQLIDPATGSYPTNYIFALCYNDGTYYLQNQIPSAGIPNGGRLWVGLGSHFAIVAGATGPGPHEGFSVVCVGVNEENIHWSQGGDDQFTIATMPPSVWTSPPAMALPATLYNISGLCAGGPGTAPLD